MLSIDRRHFPTKDDEPRQGDIVEFPEKASLPAFVVVSVERDGLSRIDVILNSV